MPVEPVPPEPGLTWNGDDRRPPEIERLVPRLQEVLKSARKKDLLFDLERAATSVECAVRGLCREELETMKEIGVPSSLLSLFRTPSALARIALAVSLKGYRVEKAGGFTLVYRPRKLEALAKEVLGDPDFLTLVEEAASVDRSWGGLRLFEEKSTAYVWRNLDAAVAWYEGDVIDVAAPHPLSASALAVWRRPPEEWLVLEILGADARELSGKTVSRGLLDPGYGERILLPGGAVLEIDETLDSRVDTVFSCTRKRLLEEGCGDEVRWPRLAESARTACMVADLARRAVARLAGLQAGLYQGLSRATETGSLAELLGETARAVYSALARSLDIDRLFSAAGMNDVVDLIVEEAFSYREDSFATSPESGAFDYYVTVEVELGHARSPDGDLPSSLASRLAEALAGVPGDARRIAETLSRGPLALASARAGEHSVLLVVRAPYADERSLIEAAVYSSNHGLERECWRPGPLGDTYETGGKISRLLYVYTRYPAVLEMLEEYAGRIERMSLQGLWRALGRDEGLARALAIAIARLPLILAGDRILVHGLWEGRPVRAYYWEPYYLA